MALRDFLRAFHLGRHSGDVEGEVADEIDFHLERRTEELVEEGLEPAEARRRAGEAFGDRARIEAETRRRHRRGSLRSLADGVGRDLRFALRTVRRDPGFSATVVVTLGLGIGAATAVFGVVDAALLAPLPFEDADRVVFLLGHHEAEDGPRIRGASVPEIEDWRRRSRSFTDVSVQDALTLTLTTGGSAAERVTAEAVSPGYFRILGADADRGRVFRPEEDRGSEASPVVVIGAGLRERRFGRDADVIGRTIRLNRVSHTIVGVMPRGFRGLTFRTELWIPSLREFAVTGRDDPDDRGSRWLAAVARLAPGVDLEEARADLASVADALEAEHPETNADRGVTVRPLRASFLGDADTLLLVLLGAAGLLLLIACANVTNLHLVRATTRSGEVAVRMALGAGRGRLVRQLVIESLVFSAAGAALGMALAGWGLDLLAAGVPDGALPVYADPSVDARVFAFAVAVTAVAGVISGLAPAVRTSGLEAAAELAGPGRGGIPRGGTGRRGGGTGRILVGAEVALAVVLLTGAGLMLRSIREKLEVDPGFDHDRVLAFRLELPEDAYPDGPAVDGFVAEVRGRLGGLPGVESVAVSSDLPLRDRTSGVFVAHPHRPEENLRVYLHRVDTAYFSTLGIPMVRGRAFGPGDGPDADRVVIIDRAFARRIFSDRNPVGELVRLGGPGGPAARIVGVAGPVRHRDLTTDLVAGADDPDLYYPLARGYGRVLEVALRTGGDPGALAAPARAAVGEIDPSLPVYRVGTLAVELRQETAGDRLGSTLLAVFGALALILAAVGIYGVIAFSVGRRSREIAVRMAVGADAARVRGMVVGEGMKVVLLGLAAGLAGALLLCRTLAGLLYEVSAMDPTTYATVSMVLAGVALAATYLPARRATAVDPGATLRSE